MLTGFNHNVSYNDRVYHVQTEDSGVKAPHVITLLYVGGNILTRIKTSYKDKLTHPDLEKHVQELMREQHKSVMRSLIPGDYDEVIAARSASAAFLNGPVPINQQDGPAPADTGTAAAGQAAAAPAPSQGAPVGGRENDQSIFADLITERPLDQVILGYLNAFTGTEDAPSAKKPRLKDGDIDKAAVAVPKPDPTPAKKP